MNSTASALASIFVPSSGMDDPGCMFPTGLQLAHVSRSRAAQAAFG
jgi:hypothetical protein